MHRFRKLSLFTVGALVVVAGYNPVSPKMEDDIRITQVINAQEQEMQSDIQESMGLNIDLPTKEEIKDRIDKIYIEQNGTLEGIDYQSMDVNTIVQQEFGEEVYRIYREYALPDVTLPPYYQEVLTVNMLNEIYWDESPFGDYKEISTVVSGINKPVYRDYTVGPYNYDDEEPVVVDEPYPMSNVYSPASMFMEDDYTELDLGNIILLNPMVYFQHYEDEEGEEQQASILIGIPVPKETMLTTDYIKEVVDAEIELVGVGKLTSTGGNIANEEYYKMLEEDYLVNTEHKIHTSQYLTRMEYGIFQVPEVQEQYVEIQVGDSKLKLPIAHESTRAHLRPQ